MKLEDFLSPEFVISIISTLLGGVLATTILCILDPQTFAVLLLVGITLTIVARQLCFLIIGVIYIAAYDFFHNRKNDA